MTPAKGKIVIRGLKIEFECLEIELIEEHEGRENLSSDFLKDLMEILNQSVI